MKKVFLILIITIFSITSLSTPAQCRSGKIAKGLKKIVNRIKYRNLSVIERKWINSAKKAKHNKKKVYKRDELFVPCIKDALGRTNIERMESGLSPIGKDGKSLELHHSGQKDKGPIIELSNTEHNKHSSDIHKKRVSEIDRQSFDKWKNGYWKERAKDFKKWKKRC